MNNRKIEIICFEINIYAVKKKNFDYVYEFFVRCIIYIYIYFVLLYIFFVIKHEYK